MLNTNQLQGIDCVTFLSFLKVLASQHKSKEIGRSTVFFPSQTNDITKNVKIIQTT